MSEQCCYCRKPLGSQHEASCIYALGFAMADVPLVKHGECNRELKHVKPMAEAKPEPKTGWAMVQPSQLERLRDAPEYTVTIKGNSPEEVIAQFDNMLAVCGWERNKA